MPSMGTAMRQDRYGWDGGFVVTAYRNDGTSYTSSSVDTTADDHAYDALRYGCMSRPIHPVSQRGNDFLTSTERQDSAPADSIFGY